MRTGACFEQDRCQTQLLDGATNRGPLLRYLEERRTREDADTLVRSSDRQSDPLRAYGASGAPISYTDNNHCPSVRVAGLECRWDWQDALTVGESA